MIMLDATTGIQVGDDIEEVKRLLLTIAVVLVGMAAMTVTSLALFTDSAAVGEHVCRRNH
ncbi:MAG: hypothetical protein ACI8Y4_003523 [Candidatus Poriferisodalaceae bacterium]|jgi:hypothetical protein